MQEVSKEITILHFNDAYDIQANASGELGFLNFYEYVQNMRLKYPHALLIFSGDAFAPSKLSRVLKGRQMAHLLAKLKIDIACYGNHDFDFAPKHAMQLAKICGCAWLMGNIKYVQTGLNIGDGLDYLIKEHCGVRMGFMGLAGPDFNGRLISAYAKKLKYFEIVEYAREMCKVLLEQGCELIIALTHARMPADTELAKQVPQIDFILGGHDHSSVFQIFNETPIIKSDSNFKCISILRVFRGGEGKEVRVGRRWRYTHVCKKVKKAVGSYPQIEQYVAEAVEAANKYERENSLAHNKPKRQHASLPQSKWNIEYKYVNNRPTVALTAGLSAEVCFAKFAAFKRNCFYEGYKRAAPLMSVNFLQDTLRFIEQEVKSHQNKGKTVLYSPGICSVPYMVQTGNLIYLPSHFLVGVDRLDQLIHFLECAFVQGYRCYAVLGCDPFIKSHLCAWIKFIDPPHEYFTLINDLDIESVLVMSCHDPKGTSHGAERNARLVRGQPSDAPSPKDIYAVFVEESYNKSPQKDINNFTAKIKDREASFWEQVAARPICSFIHDWESGIDCLSSLQNSFQLKIGEQVNLHYILNADSWKLYLIAYYLGRQFIEFNFHEERHPVRAKGVVFNQYIMSNPTYQLNYGWVPILYWQFYSNNEQRILSTLTEQEREYKRWFNVHRGTRIELIKHDSTKIATDHTGAELSSWVTKHAPLHYDLKYLPLQLILKCLSKHGLLFSQCGGGFARM